MATGFSVLTTFVSPCLCEQCCWGQRCTFNGRVSFCKIDRNEVIPYIAAITVTPEKGWVIRTRAEKQNIGFGASDCDFVFWGWSCGPLPQGGGALQSGMVRRSVLVGQHL